MKRQRVLLTITLLVLATMVLARPAGATGTVSGKVTVSGVYTKPKAINMGAEPGCAKMYSTPPSAEDIVASPAGALENVVVYISAGAADENEAPSQPVVVVQKGCRFSPHVSVIQAGQEIEIVNKDTTAHNVHPLAQNNREWNKAQPPGMDPIAEKFARPEFIPVKCNIHPWMHGYFVVLKTSHYSVTGQDGSFTLPNLPPGKYTITAWHETLGTQTQEITIAGNETAPLNIIFKGK